MVVWGLRDPPLRKTADARMTAAQASEHKVFVCVCVNLGDNAPSWLKLFPTFGGSQEGGFQKGGFGRCSPVPKFPPKGLSLQCYHSRRGLWFLIFLDPKPEWGYIRQSRPLTKPPFCFLSKLIPWNSLLCNQSLSFLPRMMPPENCVCSVAASGVTLCKTTCEGICFVKEALYSIVKSFLRQ